MIQFFIEAVIQALIRRYQNDATTVSTQQFADIDQGLPVVLDMFYHVKCEDRIVSCQLTRIQALEFGVHKIEIDNTAESGMPGEAGIEVLKIIVAQIAEGKGLVVLQEEV